MKFTLNWLKRHLDTTATLEEICAKLTDIGLEVENLEDRAKIYEPFKVAYVEKAEQHPDADRLRVCMVKTDKGTFQVVCGAPNARTGMKGVFAPEGSYIPGSDITLKKGNIRGVESQGMLVSMREMNLSAEHEGIIEVDSKYEIGTPLAEVFGLNDPVIEINLTPNRADCAGVRGIARDLAAAGLGTLKPLETKKAKASGKSPTAVKIEDTDGCKVFFGRTIRNVKNGPSPEWLQSLLKSVGLRPISTLVDITNFISVDLCRPLHVYDANKLSGDIIVRTATKDDGEFEALNDKTYKAPEGSVVIADKNGVLGLGGIVGGTSTGCTDATTNVFLECAYFSPSRISRTGRDLQVNSDARYRFERGVDPAFTREGFEIASAMILELCGGEASEPVQDGDIPDWKRSIGYSPAYLKQLIGIDVEEKRQKDILKTLGFEIRDGETWILTPPPWRGDVEGRADIAEEIARINGYDKIPANRIESEHAVPHPAETPMHAQARLARNVLAARGMDECITWSFMAKALAEHFGANDNQAAKQLTLANPISSDLDQMRPSILPNLIAAAGGNASRGNGDVALYEIGPAFHSSKPDGEKIIAAGVRAGSFGPRHWADANAARPIDTFDAKADAFALLEALGAPAARADITREAPSWYHPGRSGAIKLGPTILGYFGEIHPGILQVMDIKMPVSGFEIFLQNIPESRKKGKSHLKLETLQPVSRDFAFVVDEKMESEIIARAARGADKILIKDAYIFDVYAGKGVPEGKKSVALAVTLQPVNQTLTDKDLEAVSKKITDAVIARTGGTLRS